MRIPARRAPEREFASSGIPDLEIFWVVDEATNQERTGGLSSHSGDPERFTNARRLLRQQSRRRVSGWPWQSAEILWAYAASHGFVFDLVSVIVENTLTASRSGQPK
jgi:hypothetical protein